VVVVVGVGGCVASFLDSVWLFCLIWWQNPSVLVFVFWLGRGWCFYCFRSCLLLCVGAVVVVVMVAMRGGGVDSIKVVVVALWGCQDFLDSILV